MIKKVAIAFVRWICYASVIVLQYAHAQLSVSEGGMPTYSQAIAVPPGIAGMAPNIGLLYSAGGVNGPVGLGWSIQGISTITRCPSIRVIDGVVSGVKYTPSDRLCLDGQRLIQTNSVGTAVAFPQIKDSPGASSTDPEYLAGKDSFLRYESSLRPDSRPPL